MSDHARAAASEHAIYAMLRINFALGGDDPSQAVIDQQVEIIQDAIDAATRDKDAEIAQLKACLSRCATACVELHGNEGEDAAALIAAIHAPHDRIDSTIHDVICGYECRAASAEHERDEARAEIERLSRLAGLRANPAIEAAIQSHLKEEIAKITEHDASWSQPYQIYETGCAMMGPSVVVKWHDKQVWFAPCGDSVEIDVFPNREHQPSSNDDDEENDKDAEIERLTQRVRELEATQAKGG